jgi:phosphatidylethanolamine-binding protein (PEBP) family uncharacterized protein
MQFFFIIKYYFFEYAFAQKHLLLSKDMGGSFTIQNEFNGCGCNTTCQLSWEMFGPKVLLLCYDQMPYRSRMVALGSTTFHQIVMFLKAESTKFNVGTVQSTTSFGATGFGGPCPPVGQVHTYILQFTH